MLQQRADVPQVGPDGVRRGVALGGQVPLERVQRAAQRLGQLARRVVLRWVSHPPSVAPAAGYSTVTLLARLRGLSTSLPSVTAAWYARICSGTESRIGSSSGSFLGTRMT